MLIIIVYSEVTSDNLFVLDHFYGISSSERDKNKKAVSDRDLVGRLTDLSDLEHDYLKRLLL